MDVYDKIKNRHLLEQELGILLDDVETAIDLLEHLLTYDDEHDLNEYMEALIGDTSSVVKHFVKNLFRFTSEQEVVAVAGSVVRDDKTKESSFSKNESTTPKKISNGGVSKQNSLNRMNTKPHPQQTIILSSEVKSGDRNEQKVPTVTTESQGLQAGNTTKTNTTVQTASFIPQIKSKSSNKKNLNKIKKKKKKSSIETNITSSNNAAAATVVVATTTIPCRPQKGTPSIVCGCFGTVHKALTNCLHCGRISCEKEGFNYCPFCHNLVEEFSTVKQTSGLSAAILHKERLLKFDRDESTKRTVIYDDQTDYYSNSKSEWLNDDEKDAAKEIDESRRRDLHERKAQVLNVAF